MTVKSILVDARSWGILKEALIAKIAESGLIGFDIETEDSNRHEGLNQFMKVNDEGIKSSGKKLVFDVNRTIVTGFSFYCDEDDTAYYVNLAHADVANRLPWSEAKQLLDAKNSEAHWICHNAPYEITMMKTSLDYDLTNVICTLQLAVSAFNADQYPEELMIGAGFGSIANLLPKVGEAFFEMRPDGEMDERQSEVFGQICGKTSKAKHSYNGYVDELVYGYGLKKLTKSLFFYEQKSFDETLNGKAHMGQLTGDEVCSYGADDAYWAVRIFHRVLPMLPFQNDQLLTTFFEQENPMIHVYSDVWRNGLKINLKAVYKRREVERQNYAAELRKLQAIIREMLPFDDDPCEGLSNENWYKDGKGKKYRDRILKWAQSDLPEDDFACAMTSRGPVSNAWASERGVKESQGPNFSHYMPIRTLIYDLGRAKIIRSAGKVASDKDARSKVSKRNERLKPLIESLDAIAGIDQRMKLYLTPYLLLCDPETQRVYPVLSSELNSRRMGMVLPNAMQLAKRGVSTYIRGFYEADEEDHVICAIDWSQVELVEIGDFSGDPGFADAYGQLPFKDLHTKAVADMMGVENPKELPNFKDLRTKVGKGANFNYWYSGALNTVGESMGWSSDKMWEMTEKYRDTFAVAEQWRVDLISEARLNGYVTLPDGHRRTKFEATYQWQKLWTDRFESTNHPGMINFGKIFVRKITNRAANQIVNSMIQGSCATLAKRSIIAINRKIQELGLRARFMMPIHDELVFSVHRDDVVEFLRMAKHTMCDHPEIITTLMLDATASIGRTFEPYHPEKAPLGQVELDEAPLLKGWLNPETKDQRLDDEQIVQVIHYLFEEHEYANAA